MTADETTTYLTHDKVYRRGNSLIEWQQGHWYWELRLDDRQFGMAIGGPARTHRQALRSLRRAARREGVFP